MRRSDRRDEGEPEAGATPRSRLVRTTEPLVVGALSLFREAAADQPRQLRFILDDQHARGFMVAPKS